MNCPICQKEITLNCVYKSDLLFGQCTPHDQKRELPFKYPIGFWCTVHYNECSSYTINLELDGRMYGYDSGQLGESTTRISYMTEHSKDEAPVIRTLANLPYFTPLQDIQFYQRKIRRIMNLKAFL